MASLRPINNKVVVKRIEPQATTPSGIVIPDAAQEKGRRGKVIAVSKPKGGEVEVNVDDEIIFAPYAGNEIEVEDEKYLLLDIDEIHAVVE
jgi:chaperonin GroES